MNRASLCIAVLAVLVASGSIQAQTPATGRVVGTVTDLTSGPLPGVAVELSAGPGNDRTTVTDSSGRYAFDRVSAGTVYVLTTSLPGFETVKREGITVGPGETATIDVTQRVGCLAMVHFVQYPALDYLLTADAVVHIRVTESGIDREVKRGRSCNIANEAPALIVDVVHASRPEWRSNATIQLYRFNGTLRAGDEYVAFMNYNEQLQLFTLGDTLFIRVNNGRIDWQNDGLLGLRDGAPIQTALQRLRETYRRYTRYRQYDSQEPTTSIEKLRYKTGWVAIGTMALKRDAWVDEPKEERPFEFANDSSSARALPRRNDRIRLKKDNQARILDFGWKGEALRNVSPTTRPRDGHVSDLTGARVTAGLVYTVADVQFEPIEEADIRLVWFRLVATSAGN